MIELFVSVNTEPKHLPGYTYIGSEIKKVPITKIRNCGYDSHPHYMGLVYNHDVNAPHDMEWPQGEVWVNITKAKNKHAKLPVLKNGECVEI